MFSGKTLQQKIFSVGGAGRQASRLEAARLPSRGTVRWRHRLVLWTLAMVLPLGALADSYPSKPVRLVVPYAPGGTTDVVARIFAEKLQLILKQPFVVDSKPGANGMLGGDIVAKAPKDGYTLLLTVASAQTLNQSLYKMPYDPLKDLTPVSMVINTSVLLVVNSAVPAQTVKELVALSKAKPGTINVGAGTSGLHILFELLKAASGADMTVIPYKGTGPQLAAVLGGEVAAVMDPFTAIPHIKTGKLRPLAVMTANRFPILPDVPTIVEAGYPGVELNSWLAILAPAGTPKVIVNQLNQAVQAIVAMPDVRERLMALNYLAAGSTPEQLTSIMTGEAAKWAKVIKDTGFKVD